MYHLHKEPVKTTITTIVSRRSAKSEKRRPKHSKWPSSSSRERLVKSPLANNTNESRGNVPVKENAMRPKLSRMLNESARTMRLEPIKQRWTLSTEDCERSKKL